MTQFNLSQSGLFSAAEYDEANQTLTVVFRTSGDTYDITGVDKALGDEFMTTSGKSAIWHSRLKHMGVSKR